MLEEGRRRQQHVGVERRVRHHLVEDDREEVFALEPGAHALLVGGRGERVGVVHEEHLHRGRVVLEQRVSEEVHVHGAGGRLGLADGGLAAEAPGAAVAQRVAAAAHAELAGHRRQRQHRGHRRAAVAVALEPPAAADHRGRGVGVEPREGFDRGCRHAARLGGALECPRCGPAPQLLPTRRVGGEEGLVGPPVLEQPTNGRKRERQVAARAHREVQVRLLGERRRPRVDDHEAGAAALRVLHDRHEVDAGCGRVGAPDDDELRVRVVGQRDARHLPVEPGGGAPGGRRAHRAQQAGGAEPPEEPRVERLVREHAVGAAVAIRQDRLAAPALARLREAGRDRRERLVPGDGLEPPLPLAPHPPLRVQQPVRAVEQLGDVAHLRADESLGERVAAVAVELDHPSGLDAHLEAAGVRAVERAGGRVHRGHGGSVR